MLVAWRVEAVRRAGVPTEPLRGALMLCITRGWLGGSGGDRLSRALWHSIMGAGGFHVRVRDGIGCRPAAMATRPSQPTPRNARALVRRATASLARGSGSGGGRIGFDVAWCVRLCGADAVQRWMAAVHGGPFVLKGWLMEGDEPFGRLGPVG